MEENREAGVWQRVSACREEGPRSDLARLQREAMELAAAYRALASRLSGNPRELAGKLQRGEQANAAALAGIGILSRQNPEHLKLWQPEKDSPQRILERCYHSTRRCAAEFMARSAEADFGAVFDHLARREMAHCAMIAELLGSIR